MLAVLAEVLHDLGAEGGEIVEAEALRELVVDRGRSRRFTSLMVKRRSTSLPRMSCIGVVVGDGGGGREDVPDRLAEERLAEAGEGDLGELLGVAGDGAVLLSLEDHLVTLEHLEAADDVVVGRDGTLGDGRHHGALTGEVAEDLVDVLVGDRGDLAGGRHAAVVGELELGLGLDDHLEGDRGAALDDDGLEVELGIGDDVEVVVLDRALHALDDEVALDVLGDLRPEALLEHAHRHLAAAEAGQRDRVPQLREGLAVLFFDLVRVDRDADLLPAGLVELFDPRFHPVAPVAGPHGPSRGRYDGRGAESSGGSRVAADG
ncbi:MAG: hypothetical protein R3F20_14835 [Planctomycetota bacterium]